MRARIAILALAFAAPAAAQYVYDYSQNPVIPDSTRWSSNGSPSFTSGGVSFSGSGSLISIPPISGVNPSDYEINTNLAIKSGGGTFIHFLRANSGSVVSGAGSYESVELAVPGGFSGSGTGSLTINECVGETVTSLGTIGIAVSDGMNLRTIAFGNVIWVYVNNVQVWGLYVAGTAGNPGLGGYGMSGGSGFTSVKLGHHDTVAPGVAPVSSVVSSVLPASVSLRWQGVQDDANGIGLSFYQITRNGVVVAEVLEPEGVDNTVQPSTTYTYQIDAADYHGNYSYSAPITITTPPPQSIDPRRVGISKLGNYWGGGGEQIDTLSGNLNFSLPLVTAQGRAGWSVPVGLSYNSQNWRNDNGVNWQLGDDVGYGFGWKAQIGSLTPYYVNWWQGVDHYVYEDGTGAQYVLNQNNGGVWSSQQSIYVWFDSNANVLHFKDGSFWTMGCTSGGTEADAGTLYPTIIEDTSGNQVIVTYDTAVGLPYTTGYANGFGMIEVTATPNTSSRILFIDDVRASSACGSYLCGTSFQNYRVTYIFHYDRNDYAVPHLVSVTNMIGTAESYSFTYQSATQEPPFGSDSNFGGKTEQLASMTTPVAPNYVFTYDTAGASELQQVTFPWGGHLRWSYASDPYNSGRNLRAVSGRYLAADSAGATEWSYGISRDNASAGTVHQTMTLSDASGNGAKTWNFTGPSTPPNAWQVGLVSDFYQKASASGTVYTHDSYTWTQDAGGNPYISAKTSVTDPGTANAQSALTTQTMDSFGYGNVVQSVIYPYNSTSVPLRTYTSAYLTSSGYTSNYVRNRLVSTTLTTGGVTKTLTTNTYYTQDLNGSYPPTVEMDSSPPVPAAYRGLMWSSVTPSQTTSYTYQYGVPTQVCGSGGCVSSFPSAATNYAASAPASITTPTYGQSLSYNAWLGITSATGLNGEQLAMTYDGYGRPLTASSAYGAVYGYSYSPTNTIPAWQGYSGPDGATTTTLDGLGRPVLIQKNGGVTATVYAPCACSALAKIQKVSAPYPAGQSATGWTTYTYDGIGRTLTSTLPDGASTTTYSYSGNQTTVTDPAGKWKTFTSDVLGNLVSVTEPDPANQPGGVLTTTYTYDWANRLTGVSMPRGTATQTRSFSYSDGGNLLSATNPENGTVTYTYNTDNTLNTKTDAKGQVTTYTYDSWKRVTAIQRDYCTSVNYTYDTNPVNASFSQYSTGRLTTAEYRACVPNPYTGSSSMAVTEMYSYHPAGGVTAKQLQLGCEILDDASGQCQTWQAEADYTYNANGQVQSYGSKLWNISDYFPGWLPETIYTYTYGAWGKPVSLTDNAWASNGYGQNTVWAQNAAYDFAGHLTSVQANMGYQYYAYSDTYAQLFLTKAETWNVNGQMTGMNFTAPAGNVYGIQYNYSSAQNNGQIASKTDTVAGVTVAYQYDQLKRLISTSSTPNAGSTPAAWIESFGYDGFGNLTSKVLNGNTTPIPANAATNRLTNATYDANGNMWSGAGATMTYDAANRMTSATEVSGGTEYYGYAPDNKRILRVSPTGAMFITLYGAFGEKLGQYQNTSALGNNVWFGGQLIGLATPSGMQIVQTDRLGSVLTQFYPYGETLGSGGTPSTVGYDSLLFATYTRDSFTGLDYADQRMYASLYGRFNSPDPYQASASGSSNPRRPQSWNRYSYVLGDPINFYDPQGLFALQSGNGTDDCPPGMVFYNNGCVVAVNDGAGKGMPNGGGGGGGGAAAAPPCGPSNPSGVTLTAAQQSLLGGTSFTALSTPQELVFLVITADASQLGLNLSGYTLGSVQIAGQGASQTELNLTAANGLSSLNALTGSFGGAGIVTAPPDPMHGIYNSGNWRQAVPQWSMQVTSAASGNIQVDIDPYNPNFGGFGSWLGHAGNVIGNTLTGGDTNYLNVASALQARYPGLKIFNCP